MSQGDQDKTEQPTPYRLAEARKRGEVAKSTDLVGVLMLVTFITTLLIGIPAMVSALAAATRQIIAIAGMHPHLGPGLGAWLKEVYAGFLQSLAPMTLALVVMAMIANLAQTGPIFSSHPISPDFKRMSPSNTLKRLFSLRSLWELGKLTVKLVLLASLAVTAVFALPYWVGSIASSSPQQLPMLLKGALGKTSLYVLLVLAVVAAADLLFVRRDHLSRMRMSRRELRDETKRRDGDPEVKSRQKRQIRELLVKVRSLPRVADADVVLTNPTRFAVAIQYRPGTMRAPVVLAKGRGFLARRVRELAGRHGVPIVSHPSLTRALYKQCDIDSPVPESLYGQLAPIYRQIFARARGASRP